MAQRGMSAAAQAEVAKSAVHTFHLVRFDFSTPEYLTDAYTDVLYDGNTYLSAGNLVAIDAVSESIELTNEQIKISVSGVNQANVAVALSEDYTDKKVHIYRGFFDENYLLIADPVAVFINGLVNKFDFSENPDDGTASLEWLVSSHWADFERVAGRRTTDNDQQLHFPGDKGLEFTQAMIKNIGWGREPENIEIVASSVTSLNEGAQPRPGGVKSNI